LFASNIDFLRTKAKPFRFHRTEGANNHIKQGDTLFFAHNPIGVTYNRLPAMLTNTIHIFFRGKEHAICLRLCPRGVEGIAFQQDFYLQPRNKFVDSSIDEGNYRRFINFCKRFFYNTPFVTSMDLRWTAVRIDKEKGKKWPGGIERSRRLRSHRIWKISFQSFLYFGNSLTSSMESI
jgi:hypothetical protein